MGWLRLMFGYAPRAIATPIRVIGKARSRWITGGLPREWTPVIDAHPTALITDPLPNHVWLRCADKIREVHRQHSEFWYDPPGCALGDEELRLLRTIAAAEAPVLFQAEGSSVAAVRTLDHRVDVLRRLRREGWIVLEIWTAEPGQRGHARRHYSAAQAYCTPSGREALELIAD